MSSETIDTLTLNIYDLGKTMQSLTRRAELEYSAEVDALIQTNCRDSVRIERLLDGILDFCFDADMLLLYKKLCRYYFNIYPVATVSYINFYREMWDSDNREITAVFL